MKRQAGIGALLLVCVGVVLGTTVLRSDIAQATGLKQSQSVIVDNTDAQAVPVREQNLDGGNIRVHEEGTANVAVTGYPAADRVERISYVIVPVGQSRTNTFDTINASTLILNTREGSVEFDFIGPGQNGPYKIIESVPAGETVTIPLNETVAISQVTAYCDGAPCWFNYSIVGS